MSFRLVAKSVTLNYLERRNGVILRYFSQFGYLPGVLRKSSRSLSHLLMSSCNTYFQCSGQDACNIQYYKLYKLNLTLHYSKHPLNTSHAL